ILLTHIGCYKSATQPSFARTPGKKGAKPSMLRSMRICLCAVRLLYAFFPGGQQPVVQSQPACISMRRRRELTHITGAHLAISGFPIAALRSGTGLGSGV